MDFWLCLHLKKKQFHAKNLVFRFYNFPQKKFGDLTLSNIPPTSTTSSSTTTGTSSILTTNRRSTGLHCHIYSMLLLFQIIRAESICLFRTSLSFRVQPRVYRAGSSSSRLEPKSLSWAGLARLGDKVKIRAWLGLKQILTFRAELGSGSKKKWRFASWAWLGLGKSEIF